jgi:hypothetical protein
MAAGGLTVQNPDNLTLTWTSDNTSVATVSSTGTVTGVNAGTTTVRVSSADAAIQASCTVYVTIADGVYYIGNVADEQYLHNSGADAVVSDKLTGADTRIPQLWKITYVSDGRYAIRPMNDTSTALGIDSANDVVANETTTSNSMLSDTYLWSIGHNSTGYFFQRNGNPAKTLTLQNIGNTTGLIVCGTWTGSANCHWTLESVKGIFLRDTETKEIITSQTVKYIELGDTLTPNQLGIGYEYYGSLAGGLTWSSSNNTVASIGNAGTVTGNKRGESVVTVSATLNGDSYITQFKILVHETVSVINHFDSSLTNDTTTLNNIAGAVEFLNEVYLDTVYIRFVMAGQPSLSPFDPVGDCDSENGCCDPTWNYDCETHHRNTYRICNELYEHYNQPAKTLIIFWTDYDNNIFCYYDEPEGSPHLECADTVYASTLVQWNVSRQKFLYPVIHIHSIQENNTGDDATSFNSLKYLSFILSHEVGHTLGMREVYMDASAGQDSWNAHNQYKSYCAMQSANANVFASFMDEVLAGEQSGLCSDCLNTLRTALDETASIYSGPVYIIE